MILFVLSYHILLLFLISVFFSNERQKGSGQRWEERGGGGVERETVIKMYSVKKESIFNKKKVL